MLSVRYKQVLYALKQPSQIKIPLLQCSCQKSTVTWYRPRSNSFPCCTYRKHNPSQRFAFYPTRRTSGHRLRACNFFYMLVSHSTPPEKIPFLSPRPHSFFSLSHSYIFDALNLLKIYFLFISNAELCISAAELIIFILQRPPA
jgi:hypothetical protein